MAISIVRVTKLEKEVKELRQTIICAMTALDRTVADMHRIIGDLRTAIDKR